jgi:hypothetical protein
MSKRSRQSRLAAKSKSPSGVERHRMFTDTAYKRLPSAPRPNAASASCMRNVGGRLFRGGNAMVLVAVAFFGVALSLFALAVRQLLQPTATTAAPATVDQVPEGEIPSAESREFPSAESEAAPMSGFFTGLIIAEGILVLAAVCFFWLPPMVLLVSLGLVIGPLMGLTMRCGACPNCGRKVQIMTAAVSASKCPSCKHKLEIREKRIVDLT